VAKTITHPIGFVDFSYEKSNVQRCFTNEKRKEIKNYFFVTKIYYICNENIMFINKFSKAKKRKRKKYFII